nr:hypothetical protein BSM_05400 [uncultured archaeon]CBH40078.1 hypothetical protein BSM_35570 [uncultured archaeon]
MEKIPGWIERLLLPKLNEITGEIKALEAKIESVDNKVDVRIDAVDSRFDSLEAKLPVMEKMAEFEVLLVELEKKLASA